MSPNTDPEPEPEPSKITAVQKSVKIQSLPIIILSFFTFHKVATFRLVSKSFNEAC